MSRTASGLSPPANEAVQNPNGTLSDVWRAHFQDVADDAASAWLVGDYKQTTRPDLGPRWLLCDGRALNDVNYPELAALLKLGAASGDTGMFRVPTIAPVVAGDGGAATATWVRAK